MSDLSNVIQTLQQTALLSKHLRCFSPGSSIDLAPLLYQPADFEDEGASASPGASDKAAQTPSVLDALHMLSQQCHVFKKSAEHLGQCHCPSQSQTPYWHMLVRYCVRYLGPDCHVLSSDVNQQDLTAGMTCCVELY